MWLIPTRRRPDAMRGLIAAMEESGEVPECAVMIDDDQGEYGGVEWPSHWHIHSSEKHLEMQRAVNGLFDLHPKERWYGLMCDHHRPHTPNWSSELAESAGDWRIAMASEGPRLRVHPVNGRKRLTVAAFGGELCRLLGFIVPRGFVHLYIDDAVEDYGYMMGLVVWRGDIVVHSLQMKYGEIPQDDNHRRVWEGRSYPILDKAEYGRWRVEELGGIVDKLSKVEALKASA